MDGALPRLRLAQSLTDGVILLDAHRLDDAPAHFEGEDDEMRQRFDAPKPATFDETRAAMARWNVERQLSPWKPGAPIPTPNLGGNGKPCLKPTLRKTELWCD